MFTDSVDELAFEEEHLLLEISTKQTLLKSFEASLLKNELRCTHETFGTAPSILENYELC